MTYTETLDYLFNALPAYQNQGESAYKDNLDNTYALMEVLDSPHQKFKSIHIAGTNGKGSVSHILAAIFQKCGYKTGLYTSPHLLDFRERVRINGEMISEETVIKFTEEHKETFEKIKPSFFEMTVSLAFDTFAKEEVDIAIIETGLGGRLDSTNIITPEASVITNISMDHSQILGDTLEKIAAEKAGIIKENVPCILGDMYPHLFPIFEAKAKELKTLLYRSTDDYNIVTQKTTAVTNSFTFNKKGKYFSLETDLIGKYQARNIITALSVIDVLDQGDRFKLPTGRVVKALKSVTRTTGLLGRWQTLKQKPLWIADTAHNEAGIELLMQQITQLPHRKKFVIYGCVEDKNLERIFPLFDKSCHYIFTKSKNKRSLYESHLLTEGEKYKLSCQGAETVDQAIAIAKKSAHHEDAIIICGSTFLVADAMGHFKR
jgi:dihydrofolate synthase/folylpolyglutamate synthase